MSITYHVYWHWWKLHFFLIAFSRIKFKIILKNTILRFWNQILETAYLFYHRFVFSLAILRTKKCEKLVKMLVKITGNVCIILPIILLLTNETEKKMKTNTKKPYPPPKPNYLGRENMKMISDIITLYSPHLKVFEFVERAESESMSLTNIFLKLKKKLCFTIFINCLST